MSEKIDAKSKPKSKPKSKMTTEYEEFIGKEPSLKTLLNFININKKEFDDYNTECIAKKQEEEKIDYNVIYEYVKFAKKYTNDEYYYIGGNIKTGLDEPITTESIKQAIKLNNENQPDHMAEVASQIRCSNQLNNLQKILDIYYEKWLEEYYAPPPIPTNENRTERKSGVSLMFWSLLCGGTNPDDGSRRGGEGYEKVAGTTKIGKT